LFQVPFQATDPGAGLVRVLESPLAIPFRLERGSGRLACAWLLPVETLIRMTEMGMFLQVEIFTHHNPTRLIHGPDSLGRLADEVRRIQRRCLLVTGRRAVRLNGLLERVQDALLEAQIESVLFDQVEPNPTTATIADGAGFARDKQAAWILALGGGSALDAAKAIALAATNEGRVEDFLAGRRPERPPLALVAVPTTAGSGSEVTPDAYLTLVGEGDQLRLTHPMLFPRLAILDPQCTASMPEAVTVSTGLDALCHAIESLFSLRRSVFTDMYARAALDRLVRSLPLARAQGAALEARAEVQLGAAFAGMAVADTSTLVPHALAYPVTARYDLPHGRAVALLLPAFLERMQELEPAPVAFVGRVLGAEGGAPGALRAFVESLGVAPRLGAYGIHEKELGSFVQRAMQKPMLEPTPGRWEAADLEALYLRSL
jgi:alcohol dehydrogenase class IV